MSGEQLAVSSEQQEANYPVTAADCVVRYCPTCAQRRVVYVEQQNGERLTCCIYCQRILARTPILTPEINVTIRAEGGEETLAAMHEAAWQVETLMPEPHDDNPAPRFREDDK